MRQEPVAYLRWVTGLVQNNAQHADHPLVGHERLGLQQPRQCLQASAAAVISAFSYSGGAIKRAGGRMHRIEQ
jgi:hypothetical protein